MLAGGVGRQGRGGNLCGAQQGRVGDGWRHERPHTAQRQGQVVFRRKSVPLGEKKMSSTSTWLKKRCRERRTEAETGTRGRECGVSRHFYPGQAAVRVHHMHVLTLWKRNTLTQITGRQGAGEI